MMVETKSNIDSVCHGKKSEHFVEGMWLRNQGRDAGIWEIIPAIMTKKLSGNKWK